MKHNLVLVSASVFAMCSVLSVAHATNLEDVCDTLVTEDTKVTIGGEISGNCTIEVDNALLEIIGVAIVIKAANGDDGDLRIDDVTEDGGAAELVIKNAKIMTDHRIEIEEAWDGGVTFKNNHVETGDDLRVKPIGAGDLIFKNNRGRVVDDIRLGDVIKDEVDNIIGGLDGDMDVRNNKITQVHKEDPEDPTEFSVQSFDGNINVKNNRLNRVDRIDITSARSGDVDVKNNWLGNTETVQDLNVTSEDGDVSVLINRFGEVVDPVKIESTEGGCESERNRPDSVDQLACLSP